MWRVDFRVFCLFLRVEVRFCFYGGIPHPVVSIWENRLISMNDCSLRMEVGQIHFVSGRTDAVSGKDSEGPGDVRFV
jgi:hypothetical protein